MSNKKEISADEIEAADECGEVDYNKYPNAAEWLRDNIKENDCCDWDCEIEDLQVKE